MQSNYSAWLLKNTAEMLVAAVIYNSITTIRQDLFALLGKDSRKFQEFLWIYF